MKLLLLVTAIFEAVAGTAFLLIPGIAFSTLLNVPLDTAGGMGAARIAGAAIIALAIACWHARNSEPAGVALGIVAAMLFYNVMAAMIIAWAGLSLGIQSPFLWPAMVAHTVLGLWCIVVLSLTMRKS